MDNITERPRLPKKAFDSEYQTEFLREVRFLTAKGIKYTFVRKTRDYGISQYKYRKTPALFAALVEFYATIEAERNVRRAMQEKEPEVGLSREEIKKAQEILEKAAKQINQPVNTAEERVEEPEENKDDTV